MLPVRYSTLPSSSEMQRQLETLTLCPKKNQAEKHCNSCMMTTSSSSSSSSSSDSSFSGDYIGMESCFDLDKGICVGTTGSQLEKQRCCRRTNKKKKKYKVEREFPPPIPSLLLPCRHDHMPNSNWVLKRYYTSDGRLILREEKVRQQEYFRAHRSNGRLTLHLVVPFNEEEAAAEEEEVIEEAQFVDVKDDNGAEMSKFVENPMVKKCPIENGIAAKCLKLRANPTCFLGFPVPPIKQVQI